jgi:hypothetical protein
VFSNRYYPWKLGGALALIAVMGVYAARRGERINPMLWRCIAEPQRWKDTRLWLPVARIVSVQAASYEVAAGDPEVRIRVEGRSPGVAGDSITLAGVFRADGPRLEAERARVLPPRFRLRWLAEAVSIAVVLALLANFARHFLFRPKYLQFEKAD